MPTFTSKHKALFVDVGGRTIRFTAGAYQTDDEETAQALRDYATRYHQLGIKEGEPEPDPSESNEGMREEVAAMRVAELKELAIEKGIDLTGLRKKDDIVDAILASSPPADRDPDASAIGDSTLATLPPGHPDEHDVVAPGEPPSNQQGTDGDKPAEGE